MLCKGCSEIVIEGEICKICGTDSTVKTAKQEKAEAKQAAADLKAEKKSHKK
jgi:rRNA maturation endonuclease Nob1